MSYLTEKNILNSKEMIKNNYAFQSSMYKGLLTKNKNLVPLKECLTRELKDTDKGREALSRNYIESTGSFFIRTKALQNNQFIPMFDSQSRLEIHPEVMVNIDLQKNDLLISKDSNIGQTVLLNEDLPNHMISAGIYRLPINKHKKYIFAFMKNDLFINQLENLTPRGTSLAHAKTLFLDCLIPFPNKESLKTINFVETIVDSIIEKEELILKKIQKISEIIETELKNNQKNTKNNISTTFTELKEIGRFNSSVYSNEKKEIENLILNYKNGHYFLLDEELKIGTTPKNRVIGIDENLEYLWLTPSNCSDYGFIQKVERINHDKKNNINNTSVLFINRTSRGGTGKYVGIALFYDFDIHGIGHHNQGMYRLENKDQNELLFITAFFNSKIIRSFCSYLSVGTKMKELKSNHFTQIPIPKFTNSLKQKVNLLFSNKVSLEILDEIDFDNFMQKDNEFMMSAGIQELAYSISKYRQKLNTIFDSILSDEKIDFTI